MRSIIWVSLNLQVFRCMMNEDILEKLFLYEFFQKSHVFVESGDIFRILMMKGFSFFWDEYDIVASGCADICDRIEEATTKEIA